MTITIGKYSFDGPYSSTDSLKDKPGVYAIICVREEKYSFVDVGESHEVKSRVENHERKDRWEGECIGTLVYAVYYTPHLQQPDRMKIEQEIRDAHRRARLAWSEETFISLQRER